MKGFERAITHAINYSRNKILIVEEFIERGFPDIIGGDVFVWNGKIVLYGEMSCLRDNSGRGLIPIGKKDQVDLTSYKLVECAMNYNVSCHFWIFTLVR